jgi:hypothetical protein
MRPAVSRFVFFAILYAIWIGYLAYLVVGLPTWTNGLSPILSRPQILVSNLDVVGTIDDTFPPVVTLEYYFGPSPAGQETAAAIATGFVTSPLDGPFSGLVALSYDPVWRVHVQEVLFPKHDAPVKPGQIIFVSNFAYCRTPGRKPGERPTPLPTQLGGLGPCLLPLRATNGGKTWEVVPLPPSPGFAFQAPRIYPFDAETHKQYMEIDKADKPDRR